jgi:hypothetical protein
MSRFPLATTPASVEAFPSWYSAAPTMSPAYWEAAESIPGASPRLMPRAKAVASTGLPSLKRKSRRSVKVNVLPFCETAGARTATSGTRRNPPGTGLSA